MKAAVYARVSGQTQNTDEKVSIGDQIREGRKHAEYEGWEVVAEYTDPGESASKLDLSQRPGGAKLLDDAREGLFDVVIFRDLTRFARNARKGLDDFERLQEAGVEVVFLKDKIDTTSPSGRFFRTMLLAFAEFEAEKIKERMSGGLKTTLEKHLNEETGRVEYWGGGRPGFGYQVSEETGGLEADPEAVPAIERAFELRSEGLGVNLIARKMNEEGFKPRPTRPKGTKGAGDPVRGNFTKELVGRILRGGLTRWKGEGDDQRPRPYLGEGYERDGVIFEAPAIVSEEVFDRANGKKLDRASSSRPATERASHRYGLTGYIRHEHGDGESSTMFGQSLARSVGDVRFYRCSGSRPDDAGVKTCDGFGLRHGHRATAVQADWVEADVLARILLTKREEWKRLGEETLARYTEGTDDGSLADDKKRLSTAEAALKGLDMMRAEALGGGDLDRAEEFKVQSNDVRQTIDTLKARIGEAEERANQRDSIAATIGDLLSATIEKTGDASDGETLGLGSEAARAALLEECLRVLDYRGDDLSPRLADWAVDQAAAVFERFAVSVTLRATDDPKRPEVEVDVFESERVSASTRSRRVRANGSGGPSGPREGGVYGGVHEDRDAVLWSAEAGSHFGDANTQEGFRTG